MNFSQFCYGKIKIKSETLYTSRDTNALAMETITIYGDNGQFRVNIGSRTEQLFLINERGYTYQGLLKEIDESGTLIFDNGHICNPYDLVFIGKVFV